MGKLIGKEKRLSLLETAENIMILCVYYWITHKSALGVCNPVLIKKSVKITKKEDVERLSSWDDYVVDDSALFDIPGLTIEKFTA